MQMIAAFFSRIAERWQRFETLGAAFAPNHKTRKRILLVNRLAILIGLVNVVMFFILSTLAIPNKAVILSAIGGMAGCYFAIPFLNRSGYLNPSRLLFVLTNNFGVALSYVVMGAESGMDSAFFFDIILPLLLFTREEMGYIVGSEVLPVAAFFAMRSGILYEYFGHMTMSLAEQQAVHTQNWLFGGVIVFLSTLYLTRENDRSEKLLEGANAELLETIEELKTAQTQLVEAEKLGAVGRLVSNMAHELNSPFGAIKASSNNIREEMAQLLKSIHKFTYRKPERFRALKAHLLPILTEVPTAETERNPRAARKILAEKWTQENLPNAEILARQWLQAGLSSHADALTPFLKQPDGEEYAELALQMGALRNDLLNVDLAVNKAAGVVEALRLLTGYEGSETPVLFDALKELKELTAGYDNLFRATVKLNDKLPATLVLYGRRQAFRLVWRHLIQNAFQAMAYRGEITLEAEMMGREARFRIIDTGKGIEPQNLTRIFLPFYTTLPAGEGSGMGLYLIKIILKQHNAAIDVQSEPGCTCFQINWPLPAHDGENRRRP